MIQLALGLKVNIHQPLIWTQLQGDCCSATNINCDGSQRVTQINWNNIGLSGVINGTAIPSSVTYLDLGRNDLTGSIPSALPNGLKTLFLHGNQMSGDLPSFPPLRDLWLGYPGYPGNHFTGTLRVNNPINLKINDNWIADIILQETSQLDSRCDLSNNPLLGYPNIAALTMCTKIGLYSACSLGHTKSVVGFTTTCVVGKTNFIYTKTTAAVITSSTTELNVFVEMQLTTNWTHKTIVTFGTVSFMPEMKEFSINLLMVLRLIVSLLILVVVVHKSPFTREIKKLVKPRKTRTTSEIEL